MKDDAMIFYTGVHLFLMEMPVPDLEGVVQIINRNIDTLTRVLEDPEISADTNYTATGKRLIHIVDLLRDILVFEKETIKEARKND